MRIPVNDLIKLSNLILVEHGLSGNDAEVVTDILIEAELRGRKTHGIMRLPGIVSKAKAKKRSPMRVAKEGRAYTLVDGRENLGYLVAHRCARTAIEKAKISGIGIVSAFNTDHCGMLGYYVSMIASEKMIGLIMCDTYPRVVPWGGTEPVLGTNPLAVGIPFKDRPIIVDMSTASITNGALLLASKAGEKIPKGYAFNVEGKITADPEEALAGGVLPFGGHKGYALGLVVQILSGVLAGAAAIPRPEENYGITVIAVNPSIFMPIETFERNVAQLTETIKKAGPLEKDAEIRIPGERSLREKANGMIDGVEVAYEVLEELENLLSLGAD